MSFVLYRVVYFIVSLLVCCIRDSTVCTLFPPGLKGRGGGLEAVNAWAHTLLAYMYVLLSCAV